MKKTSYQFKVECWDNGEITDTWHLDGLCLKDALSHHKPEQGQIVCLERTYTPNYFEYFTSYAYFKGHRLEEYFCCGHKVPARFRK